MGSYSSFVTLIVAPGVAALEFDAVISERHDGEVDVTEHPVEKGANITDHARPKPWVVTIEAIISNTPIDKEQNTRIISSRGFTIETSAQQEYPQGTVGYVETAFQKLISMRDACEFMTVVTELRTYRNMILTSLTVPRDNKTGDAIKFTVAFKEILTTEILTKQVKVAKSSQGKKQDLGKQATKPTEASGRKNSLLNQGLTGLTGTSDYAQRSVPNKNLSPAIAKATGK
jgi:hypothetical protein